MPNSPETFAHLASFLSLQKLAPTVADSKTGLQVENPLVTRFKNEAARFRYTDPAKNYTKEMETLKNSGCLVDRKGNPVTEVQQSARILSHVLLHIKETTGMSIKNTEKANFGQAVKIAKAVHGFSIASGMTPDKMEVNMPYFVSAALKEVGWDKLKSQMVKPAALPPREAIARTPVKLQFKPNEKLKTPNGSEDNTPWRSENASIIVPALFKAFQKLGIQVPFNPDDIKSCMAIPVDFLPDNIKTMYPPPMVWMEVPMNVIENKKLVQKRIGISSYNHLAAVLQERQQQFPDNPPMRGINVNMKKNIAEQLVPEQLKQHPGVLNAIAADLLRYLPPGSEKILRNVRFELP